MTLLREVVVLLRRAAARVRRRRLDDELRDEITQHIELRRQQLVDDGMEPGEAAYEARRLFGNPTAVRETTSEMWSFRLVDALLQDVRFGARLLRRTPVFTFAAVTSLAIGVGAAAAVFHLADAVLFRNLPVAAPEELRSFRAVQRLGAATKTVAGVDEPTFAHIQREASFGQVAGYVLLEDVAVSVEGATSAMIRTELVSPNYFHLLGAADVTGRLIDESDTSAGLFPAVLSERLWRTAFHGDAAAIGRVIGVNGSRAVIVGTVRDFRGMTSDRPADLFLPLGAVRTLSSAAASSPIGLVVRLAAGVAPAEAEQRISALYTSSPATLIPGARVRVELPSAAHGIADTRPSLERPIALGLVLAGALLLVACANTGALLLARLGTRRREFGVRIAIGAGRGRLIRQLIVEALLLAALAAAAGLLTAVLSGPMLIRSIPATLPLDYDLQFDWRLVAFTVAAAVAAALTAAAAALFRLVRADPAGLLASGARTAEPACGRFTSALLAAQVACTLLLLVGAGSLARTLVNLRGVPPGFDPHQTFAVDFSLPDGPAGAAQGGAYLTRLLDQVSAVPGVARATLAQFGLMVAGATTGTVTVDGFTPGSDEDRWVRMYFVGPHYFETLGIPLLLGRDVQAADGTGAERIAVVNERFAEFYFGKAADPVGRRVNGNIRIVGLAADARYDTLRDGPARMMFVPYRQAPPRSSMTLLVRASGDRSAAMGASREVIHAFDPKLRTRITTGDQWLSASVAREEFIASLGMVLSVLAVFLACFGLYAVVANIVSQRRGELAIRLALGASRADVLRLVLRSPLRTSLVGIALGLPLSYAVMRSAESLLFGVAPFDLATVGACSMVLVAIALFAAMAPARRAAAIDPVETLRNT